MIDPNVSKIIPEVNLLLQVIILRLLSFQHKKETSFRKWLKILKNWKKGGYIRNSWTRNTHVYILYFQWRSSAPFKWVTHYFYSRFILPKLSKLCTLFQVGQFKTSLWSNQTEIAEKNGQGGINEKKPRFSVVYCNFTTVLGSLFSPSEKKSDVGWSAKSSSKL